MLDKLKQQLNEATSMNTVGNMTIQDAAENEYIKKYIISKFNDKVEKTIPINNMKMSSFMDEVISFYPSAKEELLQGHKINHAERGGYKYNYDAQKARLEEIAKGFNYEGCKIIFRNKSYNRDIDPSFFLDLNFKNKLPSSKNIMANVVRKLFQDSTIKRYMEKNDKLDKDFRWSHSYNVPQYETNYDFIKEVINAFVDYLDGVEDIIIKYKPYNKLAIDVSLGKGKGLKTYHVKKEMIEEINLQIKYMNDSFDRMIGKSGKYGQLLMKRFWAKPEKYI